MDTLCGHAHTFIISCHDWFSKIQHAMYCVRYTLRAYLCKVLLRVTLTYTAMIKIQLL